MTRTLVECIDACKFVNAEFEVEDVEVLRDTCRVGRLRDGCAALLQVPTQHDLGRALRVGLRYGDDRGVFHDVLLAILAKAKVEGDATDR